MSASSLKLASAVIGIGGVATGAGVGIYQLVKTPEENKDESKRTEKLPETKEQKPKQKIKDLLTEKKKSILDRTGNENKWKKNWEKFKVDFKANRLNKQSWTFEGTNNLDSVGEVTEHFKAKCEGTKELNNSDDNKLLEEVLLYCTDNGEAGK